MQEERWGGYCGLIMRLARGDASTLWDLSEDDSNQWDDLMRYALRLKVVPLLLRSNWKGSSKCLDTTVANNFTHQIDAKLLSLRKVASLAESENLRFVLIKGFDCSLELYDDLYARQFSDIDILVEMRDVSHCDYVLRKAGFIQPNWTAGMRSGSRILMQIVQKNSCADIGFPCRKRSNDKHLAPYYDMASGVKIEVHFGVAGLPEEYLGKFIWSTDSLRFLDFDVRVPKKECMALLLLLTAASNTQDYYSLWDGDASLRDFCDIKALLDKYEQKLDWEAIGSTIAANDFTEMIAQLIGDYQIVFPGDYRLAHCLALTGRRGTAERDVVTMLFDESYRKKSAFNYLQLIVSSLSEVSVSCGSTHPNIWTAYDNNYGIDVSYAVSRNESMLVVSWKISSAIKRDIAYLGFQMGLVLTYYVESVVEYCVNVSVANKGSDSSAVLLESPRITQQFGFGRCIDCLLSRVDAEESYLIVNTFIPLSLIGVGNSEAKRFGLRPVVYRRCFDNAYHMLDQNCGASELMPKFVIQL